MVAIRTLVFRGPWPHERWIEDLRTGGPARRTGHAAGRLLGAALLATAVGLGAGYVRETLYLVTHRTAEDLPGIGLALVRAGAVCAWPWFVLGGGVLGLLGVVAEFGRRPRRSPDRETDTSLVSEPGGGDAMRAPSRGAERAAVPDAVRPDRLEARFLWLVFYIALGAAFLVRAPLTRYDHPSVPRSAGLLAAAGLWAVLLAGSLLLAPILWVHGRRRGAAAALVVAAGAFALTAWQAGRCEAGVGARPVDAGALPRHVVLITIDTLRADHLGCYGSARRTSPSIDRLAAEGIVYDHVYCTMPSTDPSHTSMLTGLYPREHGVLKNGMRAAGGPLATIASDLASRGFRTAAITSRKHLNPGTIGLRGFGWWSVPERVEPEERAEATARRAADWIAKNAENDFFLWVHFWDPHFPYRPPAPYDELFPEGRGAIPAEENQFVKNAAALTPDRIARTIALYDGEIAYLDHWIGWLVDRVDALTPPIAPPIVIITADHGESLDERLAGSGFAFAHEAFLDEDLIRVPLIVRWRGILEDAGTRRSLWADNTRLRPMIRAFADRLGKAARVKSDDFERGGTPAPPRSCFAVVQRRLYEAPPVPELAGEQVAVVVGDGAQDAPSPATRAWKGIFGPGERAVFADVDATDLVERPAVVSPSERSMSLEWLTSWRKKVPAARLEKQELEEERLRELRQLGYVQ